MQHKSKIIFLVIILAGLVASIIAVQKVTRLKSGASSSPELVYAEKEKLMIDPIYNAYMGSNMATIWNQAYPSAKDYRTICSGVIMEAVKTNGFADPNANYPAANYFKSLLDNADRRADFINIINSPFQHVIATPYYDCLIATSLAAPVLTAGQVNFVAAVTANTAKTLQVTHTLSSFDRPESGNTVQEETAILASFYTAVSELLPVGAPADPDNPAKTVSPADITAWKTAAKDLMALSVKHCASCALKDGTWLVENHQMRPAPYYSMSYLSTLSEVGMIFRQLKRTDPNNTPDRRTAVASIGKAFDERVNSTFGFIGPFDIIDKAGNIVSADNNYDKMFYTVPVFNKLPIHSSIPIDNIDSMNAYLVGTTIKTNVFQGATVWVYNCDAGGVCKAQHQNVGLSKQWANIGNQAAAGWTGANVPPNDNINALTQYYMPGTNRLISYIWKDGKSWKYECENGQCNAIKVEPISNIANIGNAASVWGGTFPTGQVDAVAQYIIPNANPAAAVLKTYVFSGSKVWHYTCTNLPSGSPACNALNTQEISSLLSGFDRTAWASNAPPSSNITAFYQFFTADGLTLKSYILQAGTIWSYDCYFTAAGAFSSCKAIYAKPIREAFAGIRDQHKWPLSETPNYTSVWQGVSDWGMDATFINSAYAGRYLYSDPAAATQFTNLQAEQARRGLLGHAPFPPLYSAIKGWTFDPANQLYARDTLSYQTDGWQPYKPDGNPYALVCTPNVDCSPTPDLEETVNSHWWMNIWAGRNHALSYLALYDPPADKPLLTELKFLNGFADVTDCNQIAGWACDMVAFTPPLKVNFTSDGQDIGSIDASAFRGDLQRNCGFNFPMPQSVKDGREHEIKATSKLGNYQLQLNNSPKKITCAAPVPPTSTRIPTSCPILPVPTGMSPIGTVNGATGQYTFTWNAVPGNVEYALRVDDLSNPFDYTYATVNGVKICTATNPGDICNDHVGSNSYSVTLQEGHSYSWWVHSQNACGYSTHSPVTITVPAASIIGSLDAASCTSVSGWAARQPGFVCPASVDIYSDGVKVANTIASVDRPTDVGKCGFVVSPGELVKDGVQHRITAKATLNGVTGTLPDYQGAKYITCPKPTTAPVPTTLQGSFDTANCTGIWGWARTRPASLPGVKIAILSDGVQIGSITPNQARADVEPSAPVNIGFYVDTKSTFPQLFDGRQHRIQGQAQYGTLSQTLGDYLGPQYITCSNPTPIPTSCPILTAPTIIGPTGTITGNAGTYTFSWSAVAGVSTYSFRLDDKTNGWTNSCASVNPGDVCVDNLSATKTSTTATLQPGHIYGWWIHAVNSCGFGSPGSVQSLSLVAPVGPTAIPTVVPTATRTPSPTTVVPTPTSGPIAGGVDRIITFNGLTGQAPENIPSEDIKWGAGQWYISAAWGLLSTSNISFTQGDTQRTGDVTFLKSGTIIGFDSYSSTSGTITVSCANNPTRTFSAFGLNSYVTGWTNPCNKAFITSSNGWFTSIDNFKIRMFTNGGPVPTTPVNPTTPPVSPTSGPSTGGSSLLFNGQGQFATTQQLLPSLTTFTFETWVKRSRDTGGYETLIGNPNSSYNQTSFIMYIDGGMSDCKGASDQFAFYGKNGVQLCSGVTADTSWHHVAVTRDSAGATRMFVDGKLRQTWLNSPVLTSSTGKITLGKAGDFSGEFFPGNIDETRISTTARYTTDFTPQKNLSSDANALLLWRFNENSGQTVADSSGHGYTLTLGVNTTSEPGQDPTWSSLAP